VELHPIIGHIVKNAVVASHAIKDFAVWSGHKIQLGYSNYLVPAIKTLWNATASSLKSLFQLMKNGHGLTFAIAGGLFVAGIAAFKIADHQAYEQDAVSKAAWKTLGIAAFVTATVATSVAIASLIVA
jgi:hypothetical protein